MYNKIKYLLICCVMLPMMVVAQQVDNSPFSSFGIGNLHNDNLAFYQGSGGLSASYIDAYHINIKNPASYAFLNSAAYELGVSARYFNVNDENNKGSGWYGNLDYLVLGFPLRNPINASLDPVIRDWKFGMSLFLKPHSTVGYNISSIKNESNLGTYQSNFEGSGGLYKLMWGNAAKYKSFSVGANIGYLFGNIRFNENIFFEEENFAFENRYSIDYNVNGFIWDAGLLYNWFINKDAYEKDKSIKTKVLNFGIYGNSAQRFSSVNYITKETEQPGLGITDTLFFADGLKGEGTLPAELGFGVTYFNDNKYVIGFNYEYGAWSQYKNSARNETLLDSWKLSLGGSYRPDAKSFNNYFKRVSYKMGVFYQKDPQVIEDIQITDAGFNLGASFPFYYQRKISHINAAFRFGIKGTGTPIQERYGKVTLGFTFNDDEWFIKRKYN